MCSRLTVVISVLGDSRCVHAVERIWSLSTNLSTPELESNVFFALFLNLSGTKTCSNACRFPSKRTLE